MIAFAKQNGGWVELYDERNCLTYRLAGNLSGYTQETVTIEKDGSLYIYNDRAVLQCIR